MTLFCGVIAAAAGGVRLFDGRQQTAGGPTRDAQLMQLDDVDYLPGPRCLDQAAKVPGAVELTHAQPATRAGAP